MLSYSFDMLRVYTFPVTLFQQNCRLLVCSQSNDAVLIDPGGEADVLLHEIDNLQVNLRQVWLTHSHLDHCGGVAGILSSKKVELIGHAVEQFMRESVCEVASMYGIPEGLFADCPEPDIYIAGGEELSVGQSKFKVLFTPGHSPGHVSFYNAGEQLLIAGDLLFAGSIGRTDLPGGDYQQLIESVRREFFVLPGDTKLLPGHGPDSTIAREMAENPFFR